MTTLPSQPRFGDKPLGIRLGNKPVPPTTKPVFSTCSPDERVRPHLERWRAEPPEKQIVCVCVTIHRQTDRQTDRHTDTRTYRFRHAQKQEDGDKKRAEKHKQKTRRMKKTETQETKKRGKQTKKKRRRKEEEKSEKKKNEEKDEEKDEGKHGPIKRQGGRIEKQ